MIININTREPEIKRRSENNCKRNKFNLKEKIKNKKYLK
jgi:hypothetical protein